MQPKSIAESRLISAMQMQPQDANPAGNVHGGVIMKQVDTTAGIVAIRHSGLNVVTASIDRLDFFFPVYVGDLLILSASVNMVGRTSMEIGVRVEAENPRTGARRHTASAYLTFVALDAEGKPAQVPELILETEEEKRRHQEAHERRKWRLAEKKREAAGRGKD
jgi:uncharacterized protein (TIGR00369 family)